MGTAERHVLDFRAAVIATAASATFWLGPGVMHLGWSQTWQVKIRSAFSSEIPLDSEVVWKTAGPQFEITDQDLIRTFSASVTKRVPGERSETLFPAFSDPPQDDES